MRSRFLFCFSVPGNSWIGLGTMAALCGFFAATPAWAQEPPPPEFLVTPEVGVQEDFTNNAFLTPTGQKSDFITSIYGGGTASFNTGRTSAHVTGKLYYDQYAENTGLSDWAVDANGSLSYQVISDFLSIDGEGTVTTTSVSTFNTPAIERTGTPGQILLSDYDIGPHIKTTIDDFADLDIFARLAQVGYGDTVNTTLPVPSDSTIIQSALNLDTKSRYAGYQLVTSAEYEKDDHGFQLYNAFQSAYISLIPGIRGIVRGGYDNAYEANVIDISAPMWSAGLEYTINDKSKISVETGERYNHSAWAADLSLQISDKLFATGRYYETLEPDQAQVNESFVDFINQQTDLPTPLVRPNFTVTGNLYNQPSLNKAGDFQLVYDWEGQALDVSFNWSDQQFIITPGHDRTLETSVSYRRQLAPDLSGDVEAYYAHTFASPVFGASETYNGTASLIYAVNPTMNFSAGLAFQQQQELFVGGVTIQEVDAFIAVSKNF